MPTFVLSAEDTFSIFRDGEEYLGLSTEKLNFFNSSLLGLGDISAPSTPIGCVAAVFDLQGFTNFCKQIDPELAVPHFLKDFLDWMFEQIKKEQTSEENEKGALLYAALPFYVKFLGDGLLFLWNTKNEDPTGIHNTIAICSSICRNYKKDLYPQLIRKFVEPPALLRCGLARGTVLSVGDGNDYVGSCINMAARLQKLASTLTFAFNCRGFQSDQENAAHLKGMIIKRTEIRGIGSGELIAVREREFSTLPAEEKLKFTDI